MTTDDDAVATKAMAAATTADAAAGRPTKDKQYGRQAGFLSRLTTGTGAFNILGYRKVYYAVSGGSGDRLHPADRLPRLPVRHRLRRRDTLQFQPNAGTTISTTEVAQVVTSATGVEPDAVQTVGNQVEVELVDAVDRPGHHGQGGAERSSTRRLAVSPTRRCPRPGARRSPSGPCSRCVVFLVAVAGFLWVRYETPVRGRRRCVRCCTT